MGELSEFAHGETRGRSRQPRRPRGGFRSSGPDRVAVSTAVASWSPASPGGPCGLKFARESTTPRAALLLLAGSLGWRGPRARVVTELRPLVDAPSSSS